MSEKDPKNEAGRATGEAPAPSPKPRPGALNTIGRVRLELSRVYRDMRTGKVRPSDGAKYCYVLSTLSKILEAELLQVEIDDDGGDVAERLLEIFEAGRNARAKSAPRRSDDDAPYPLAKIGGGD